MNKLTSTTKIVLAIAVTAITALFVFLYQQNVTNAAVSENEVRTNSPAYSIKQMYGEEMLAAKKRRKANQKDEHGIKHATKYLHRLRMDPKTGKVPVKAVIRAHQKAKAMRNSPANRNRNLNLEWELVGPDNIGGRTRGFMIDRVNTQRILTGGVTGGLFVSNDGGLNWELHPDPVFDNFASISTIQQAPSDPNVIYVGTGESFVITEPNQHGHLGGGIYKSTDGGQTFSLLPSTKAGNNAHDADWAYVNEIAIHPTNPNIVYAATGVDNAFLPGGGVGALYRSDDGGQSWTQLTDVGNEVVREVVMSSTGIVYAEADGLIYRSVNGTSFDEISTTTPEIPTTGIERIEFAIAPQDPNYVYALFATGGDRTWGVLRSTDTGVNWEEWSPINSVSFNPGGEQANYDHCIAVDPTNKDRVIVGGQLELWAGGQSLGWDMIAYWAPSSPTNPYYVHADMHNIVFDPSDANTMYVASDGGIFKTTNAQDQFPVFTERNKDYTSTQYYHIDADSKGRVIGGMQDNGTALIEFDGNTRLNGDQVSGGDGGYAFISEINPEAMFVSIQQGELRRTSNGGESFSCFYALNVTNGSNPCDPSGSTEFIHPYYLWENVDSNEAYLVSGHSGGRLFITNEPLNFSQQPCWYILNLPGSSTVSEVQASDDGVFYVGGSNGGRVWRVEGLTDAEYICDETNNNYTINGATTNAIQPSGSNPWNGPNYVAGFGIDPNNSDRVIVCLGGYSDDSTTSNIYITDDASVPNPTWTSIKGNLPQMPVYDAVIDANDPNKIIIATDLGVWSTSDGGNTWFNENSAPMSSTPVFKIRQVKLYEDNCKVIYIGTYGRGVFRTTTLTNPGCTTTPGIGVGIAEQPALANNFTIAPNPVTDKAILQLDVAEAAEAQVSIVDLNGKVLKTVDMGRLVKGSNRFELSFEGIPRGVFVITVDTEGQQQSETVFVAK